MEADTPWHPDAELTAALEEYFDGPRASWAEAEWERLAVVVRRRGAWEDDDEALRTAIGRNAMFVMLLRSGIPGVDARVARRLVERFGTLHGMAEEEPDAILQVAPQLSSKGIERLRALVVR
jgi:hypothetical protein